MGLSAKTSDNTGLPLGEGYVTLSTSAGNALLFSDPADANIYMQANPAQFDPTSQGNYNTNTQLGQS